MRNLLRHAALSLVLLPLAVLTATAAGQEFDPDRALRDPAFAEALKTIADEQSAAKAFEQHGLRAYDLSNQLMGFLHKLAGGEYVEQIERLMDVPVQQWNPNRGWTGSYDIVKVKQIVQQNRSSSLFGSVNDAMGHVATALSCIQVGRDIAAGIQGDDAAKLKALHGTYNVLVGWWIKELSWQTLGTAMMGVAFLGSALGDFQAAAQQHYEDYWWIAYSNYLEATYPKLVTGDASWAAVARTEGHDGIRRRLDEFWDDPYTHAATHHGRAGIQTAPALADRTLRHKFAAAYYTHRLHASLKTYFRLEAEKAEAAAHIEGRRAFARLKTLLDDAELLRQAVLDASDVLDEVPVEDLEIAAAVEDPREGDRIVLTAAARYEDGTRLDVTELADWSRNAPGGVIERAPGGDLRVEASFAGKTTVLAVLAVPLAELVGAPDPALLKPGEPAAFTLTAVWEDGVRRDVSAEAVWPDDLPGGRFAGGLEPDSRRWRVRWREATATVSAEILPPAAVNVNPAALQLRPGEEAAFTAEAVYETGEAVDVTAEARWGGDARGPVFSSDEPGLYRIEAAYLLVEGHAEADVLAPAALEISPASAQALPGETVAFAAEAVWPDGGRDDVTARCAWPAEAPGGLFTAQQEGSVTFMAEYLGATADFVVDVAGPTALTLEPAAETITLAGRVPFTATALLRDGRREAVTHLADFGPAAPGGVFTPSGPGAFTVTAAYAGLTASATVTVQGPDQLFLEPAQARIAAGEQVAFTATARFPDGSLEDVTAAAVIAGAPGGVYTATATGDHAVVCTYGGLSASALVSVTPGSALALAPAAAECAVGESVGFRAVRTAPDGTSEDVTDRVAWQNAPGGVYTGAVPGEAVIGASLGGLSATARVRVAEGPADLTVDEAAADIAAGAAEELCDPAELQAAAQLVRGLLARGDQAAAAFRTFALKFDKELADRAADPCANSLLAYCFAGAAAAADELAAATADIADAATTLLAMQAWCPQASAAARDAFTAQSLVSQLAALGAADGEARRTLAAMRGRLGDHGCDENEFDQLADRIVEQGMDPDMLQAGGAMQEIAGDGVDNDGDGLQEENVQALSGYNVTVVLYDSGNLKDDVFHLSVSGVGALGATPAGGLRSYGLDLPPGAYTATVTVVLAPDNVGTFTVVVMEDGATVASGAGEPPQGGVYTLPFTIAGQP